MATATGGGGGFLAVAVLGGGAAAAVAVAVAWGSRGGPRSAFKGEGRWLAGGGGKAWPTRPR